MIGSDFHKEKETFIDKVSAFAKFAGVAAVALGSVPYISKSVASQLAGQGTTLRKYIGAIAGVQDSKILFSDSFNFMADSVPRIRRSFLSSALKAERRTTFLNAMRENVEDSSREAFDTQKHAVAEVFDSFMDGNYSKIADGLLQDTHMKRFQEATPGIQFKTVRGVTGQEEILEKQRKMVQESMKKAIKETPDIRTSTIFQGVNGAKNADVLFDSIKRHLNETQSVETKTLDLLGLTKSHKLLTLKDVEGTHKAAVETYLKNVGSDDTVDIVSARARKGLEELLYSKGKDDTLIPNVPANIINDVNTLVDNTFTGLAMSGDGQVVSLSHARNMRRKVASSVRKGGQIPLLPFTFNIPTTIGKFLEPDNTPIKNLGFLNKLGELKRMGGSFGENDFGIGIGSDIIKVNHLKETDSFVLEKLNLGDARRFTYLDNERSEILQNMSRARSDIVDDNLFKDLLSDMDEKGNIKGAANFFFQRESKNMTKVERAAYNAQPELFTLLVEDGKLKAKPRNLGGVGSDIITRFFGGDPSNVTSDQLHPKLVAGFLKENEGKIPTAIAQDLQRRLGATVTPDSYNDLNTAIAAISKAKVFDGDDFLVQLAEVAGDTDKLGAFLRGSDLESRTNSQYGATLSKALADYVSDSERLGDVSKATKGGFKEKVEDTLLGENSLSYLQKNIQRGLVEEASVNIGVKEIEDALAGSKTGFTTLEGLLRDIRDPLSANPESVKFFESYLGAGVQNLANLADTAFSNTAAEEYIPSVGRSIASGLASKQGIDSLIEDPIARLISLEKHRSDSLLLSAYTQTEDRAVNATQQLANNLGVFDYYDKNIFQRGVEPPTVPEEVFSRYTVLPSNFPSLGSMLTGSKESMLQMMAEQAKRGFGMLSAGKGLVYNSEAQGYFGTAFTALSHGAVKVLEDAGLGLASRDTTTFAKTHAALYAKRILPVIVAGELYRNFNADMHEKDLEGIDDYSANIYANTRINSARLRDNFGLTDPLKNLVYGVPGLDNYLNPLSEEETREDILYGNEFVRTGRLFSVGNRNPLYGGAVESARPNAYRRWKSHWTEADNVQLSNPNYSYLPTLTNPFAPLFRLFNRDWQQDLTAKDRPYASKEEMFDYLEKSQEGYASKNSGNYLQAVLSSYKGQEPVEDFLDNAGVGGSTDEGGIFRGFGIGKGSGGGGSGGGHGSGGGGGGEGGSYGDNRVYKYGYNKHYEEENYHHNALSEVYEKMVHHTITPMGIYSGVARQLPFYPEEHAFQIQDPDKAFSTNRLLYSAKFGEKGTGMFGEFFRRFIDEPRQDPDAFNPLPNSMPGWMPSKFRTGDPYARVSDGELVMPGDAYERANPFVRPLKIRGSSIGLSEDEMVKSFLDPVGVEQAEQLQNIMEFGSAAHKIIMQQMNQQGILVGAEIAAYDESVNGSATIETLVRGKSGLEVVEIKTRGTENINEDVSKYEDQLMYYMYLTKTKVGHIAHVNRDNPSEVRIKSYEYDPHRMQEIFEKVERARNRVKNLIEEGVVSPYETYGLLERIEVLAKVAPESSEYRRYLQRAEDSGAFGGMEARRFEIAKEIARRKSEMYNLYPKRNVRLETQAVTIEGFTDTGNIITDRGIVKLAGVDFDPQAFTYQNPEDVYKKYGLSVGKKANLTLIQGQFNPELMKHTVLDAIIEDVNRELIKSDYADSDYKSRNPLANRVIGRTGFMSSITEYITHSDNMVSNKYLRVRTGLEQFKRGEVYGTDDYSLRDIKDNYVTPTINSIISKDPITAGIQSALAASIFARTRQSRLKVAKVAAVVGASLSIIRNIGEAVSGDTWTPKRYKDRAEFDEYYDTLTFIKEASISNAARKKEGVDELSATMQESQFNSLATDAEFKARRTMYGFDVVSGTLQEALDAIPKRQRQIAESIVTTGTDREKEEFYRLLPRAQKRVLGKFLGKDVDDVPDKPTLKEYFRDHALPGADWQGWKRDVDLEDIKTRASELEGIKIARPSRKKLEKAKAYTRDIEVPRMNRRSRNNIEREIGKLASSGEFGKIIVNYSQFPTEKNVININLNVFSDISSEIEAEKERTRSRLQQ